MPTPRRVRSLLPAALFLALASVALAGAHQVAPPAKTGQIVLSLDPAKSSLHWNLGSTLHTVHGTFNLKSGEMRFDPETGSASGEFVAYATSGDSGNDSRDKKMHKEILESAKYPEVAFRPSRIEGSVAAHGASNAQLHGTFLLHGSEHEMTIPVQAELNGDTWKGTAKFTIPYISWGLKSPNTFMLKADPAVQIELELAGNMHPATP